MYLYDMIDLQKYLYDYMKIEFRFHHIDPNNINAANIYRHENAYYIEWLFETEYAEQKLRSIMQLPCLDLLSNEELFDILDPLYEGSVRRVYELNYFLYEFLRSNIENFHDMTDYEAMKLLIPNIIRDDPDIFGSYYLLPFPYITDLSRLRV